MDKKQYENHRNILIGELKVALGCTEPIAIAYAGAKAREVLGVMPQSCAVRCSGNMVKNVKGVVVPNSNGLRGIAVAAVLGIVGGNPDLELAVLEEVTDAHRKTVKKLLEEDFCDCILAEGVENLYVEVEVRAEDQSASVEIQEYHSNITRIVKNGTVLLQKEQEKKADEGAPADKSKINLRSILEFADTLEVADVEDVISRQFDYNISISKEGLQGNWGVQAGKTLLSQEKEPSLRIRARAAAAAGSDARMGGCPLPVVINSGSGNQGITLALPLHTYAEAYQFPMDIRIRALALANLIAVHQKKYIGQLSAYCGAVSAATASACGIAYMLMYKTHSREEIYQVIGDTITNSICTIGGMVCDGAKSSCATKISAAVETALTSMELAMEGHVFQPKEGLTMDHVEDTICAVGRMGRQGMLGTDLEIIHIMLGK